MLTIDVIKELCKYPPDTKVVLSGDPEGNYYWKVGGFGICPFKNGEILHEDDDMERVLVIWPGGSFYP